MLSGYCNMSSSPSTPDLCGLRKIRSFPGGGTLTKMNRSGTADFKSRWRCEPQCIGDSKRHYLIPHLGICEILKTVEIVMHVDLSLRAE